MSTSIYLHPAAVLKAGARRADGGPTQNLAKTDGPLASPAQIAGVIVRAATASRPKARYVAPLFGRVTVCLCRLLSDRAFDWLMGRLFRIPKSLGAGA